MFRRSVSLGVSLLVLQVVIVLMTTCAAGLLAAKLQSDRIREAYKDRMLSVAESVARLPTVVQAFDSPDPAATIQPLAELIRKASQVTYVVVTDSPDASISVVTLARPKSASFACPICITRMLCGLMSR